MRDYGDSALAMWEGWSRARAGIPANDPWLERFAGDLEPRRNVAFLDLGCGTGADTFWLLEHGYDVTSADYAREALRSIERSLSGSKTAYVDMRKPLPFPNGSFGVIVSSSSILARYSRSRLLGPCGAGRKAGWTWILTVRYPRASSIQNVGFGDPFASSAASALGKPVFLPSHSPRPWGRASPRPRFVHVESNAQSSR